MKANLKNLVGLAALGMTLLTSTVPTWAGRVVTDRVMIASNQFGSWAFGNLVDVRDSADTSREQIGCRAQILSTYSWTSCHAMDSAGRSLTCGSGDWKFLEIVHGMTDSSSIYFAVNGAGNTGECQDIRIHNLSDQLR
jgi:hypothetical protein